MKGVLFVISFILFCFIIVINAIISSVFFHNFVVGSFNGTIESLVIRQDSLDLQSYLITYIVFCMAGLIELTLLVTDTILFYYDLNTGSRVASFQSQVFEEFVLEDKFKYLVWLINNKIVSNAYFYSKTRKYFGEELRRKSKQQGGIRNKLIDSVPPIFNFVSIYFVIDSIPFFVNAYSNTSNDDSKLITITILLWILTMILYVPYLVTLNDKLHRGDRGSLVCYEIINVLTFNREDDKGWQELCVNCIKDDESNNIKELANNYFGVKTL